jgi:hypothetical protein
MAVSALTVSFLKTGLRTVIALGLILPGSLWAALQVWGTDVLLYRLQPAEAFREEATRPAPDYRDSRSWAALPGKHSAAMLFPRGETKRVDPAAADVFYIHPTSYLSGESWNAPLHVDSRAWEMVQVMLAAQASAFNRCCDVYAPHYRQATLWSFLDREGRGGQAALELAYRDIERAFDEFLRRTEGRPFIIASHSQGTYHAVRLLSEKVEGTSLADRLVVAYLIGYWLPLDTFARLLPATPPCEKALDTGCVVHWSTYGEQGIRRSGVPHWYPEGIELVDGKPLLCTNPLNWLREGPREEASVHPGALYVEQGGTLLNTLFDYPAGVRLNALEPVLPDWTWAECRDGLLRIAEQSVGVFAENGAASDQDYHILDYSLFYQAIRENAVDRVEHFGGAKLAAVDGAFSRR